MLNAEVCINLLCGINYPYILQRVLADASFSELYFNSRELSCIYSIFQ